MKDFSSTVAIVGIGGIFPDAPDLDAFWDNIRSCRTAFREVPDGRWPVPTDAVFDQEAGKADCVYSRRGCFIDPLPPATTLPGLVIDPARLDGLDPLFHLLIHAGKRAFDDGVTAPLDRSRVGVIIGNLALPSETSAVLTRTWLGRTFEEQLLGSASPPSPTSPLNRYVAGLPAGILAQALGLGGGSCALDAACASSLYAIKMAMDELLSGRCDAMLTGGVSRPDPLFTQMGFSQLRALSKRGICSPLMRRGTASWSVKAPVCSCSNALKTPWRMATVSMESSGVSALPTMSAAACLPRCRKASCARCIPLMTRQDGILMTSI